LVASDSNATKRPPAEIDGAVLPKKAPLGLGAAGRDAHPLGPVHDEVADEDVLQEVGVARHQVVGG